MGTQISQQLGRKINRQAQVFERKHIPLRQQIIITLTLASILAAVELLNILSTRQLNHFGILPRSVEHLSGIVLAPFLHGSLMHFISNIVPLVVFSFLLLQHGLRRYFLVSVFVVIFGGGLVWLFARSAIHIGASGVVFGYFGFLLLAGFISREVKLILISLFVGMVYGSLVIGVLPVQPGVSWESHLTGLLAGFIAAIYLGKAPTRPY